MIHPSVAPIRPSASPLYICDDAYSRRVTETFLDRTIGFVLEFLALGILTIDYGLQMCAEGLRFIR